VSATTAANNVVIGFTAGHDLSTGSSNTFMGTEAGYANTTGAENTSVGKDSLKANTTGPNNSAVGQGALLANTTGLRNSAVGSSALSANTTGGYNTATGVLSLLGNTTGSYNTASGYKALNDVTTGTHNIGEGYLAGTSLTTGSYNIFFGTNTKPEAVGNNQTIVLGTTGGSAVVGKGANTGFINPNGGYMFQGNNQTVWAQVSDERLKKNIVNNNVGLAKINAIQVRNFDYKTAEEVGSDGVLNSNQAIIKTGTQLGVIAQELELICPDCVTTQSSGVKVVSGDDLHWHMLNAIKELSTQNAALAARITTLDG